MASIEAEVRQYILDNFLFGRTEIEVSSDASFLDLGIIDSTGVLELITFLEDKYKIKINDDELVPENLDSLKGITRFVEAKRVASTNNGR
jgi:acyl carrier protein